MSQARFNSGSQIFTIGTFACETQTTRSIPSVCCGVSQMPKCRVQDFEGSVLTFCQNFCQKTHMLQVFEVCRNTNIHYCKLAFKFLPDIFFLAFIFIFSKDWDCPMGSFRERHTIRITGAEFVTRRAKYICLDFMSGPLVIKELLQFTNELMASIITFG